MKPRALCLFSCAGGIDVGLERAGFDTIGVDWMPSQQPKDSPHYSRNDGTQHWAASGECHMADLSTADAIEAVIRAFQPDLVTASPPCQKFSVATPTKNRDDHPDLISSTREGILRAGVPGWIENVATDAVPLTGFWIMLCGIMFPETYHIKRHRRFELLRWKVQQPYHDDRACVYDVPSHLAIGVAPHASCALCEEFAAEKPTHRRGRNGRREVISVAGDGSGTRGRGPRRRKTLTLAGNQGEGPGQTCGQNRAGVDCIRWRRAMGWIDGPVDRYSLRQAIPPAYGEWLGRAFLETRGGR